MTNEDGAAGCTIGGLSSVAPDRDPSSKGDLDAASEEHLALSAPEHVKEPAALKWLASSLDAAQQALVELRADAGRDVSQGARDLHKDLRAFISNARRDTGKLTKALQRDFEHAQKQLAEGTGIAGEPRAKTAASPARKPRAAAKRSAPKAS